MSEEANPFLTTTQWLVEIMIQYSYVHFVITNEKFTRVSLSDRGVKYYSWEEDYVKSDFGQWKLCKVNVLKNYLQILILTI